MPLTVKSPDRLIVGAVLLAVCTACVNRRSTPEHLNVVEFGADPTGTEDCTALLTQLHATGKAVHYPNCKPSP